MQTLDLTQGSDEWKEIRSKYCVASEAPIIMGDSPYTSRDELLRMKSTGDEEEITKWKQKIFDKGHTVEALARPIIEERNKEELYPVVGITEIDGLNLLASFDGITMMEDWSWECKQFNQQLFESVYAGEDLTGKHYWQLEHQLLVSGADYVLFTVSDGTTERTFSTQYISVPERREQLIEGWKLFLKDLEKYQPVPVEVKPEGKKPKNLPALDIQVTSSVIASNLDLFKSQALEAIESVNTTLKTDQDFSDAEEAVKWFKDVESKLSIIQEQVLSQASDVNEVISTLDDLREQSKKKRLDLDKLVSKRKQDIRDEIALTARTNWKEFMDELNEELKPCRLPLIDIDIGSAMRGKRSPATLRSAANNEVARAKIEANRIAKIISENLEHFDLVPEHYKSLFNDLNELSTKDHESFKAVLNTRIQEQQVLESQKESVEQEEVQTPPPSSTPALKIKAPQVKIAGVKKRPDDEKIIEAIATAFGVDNNMAISWIKAMDLNKLAEAANQQGYSNA